MKIIVRTGPVIGQPISPEEARALRDEAFLERWRPWFDAVEAWSTPAAFVLCALMAGMIVNGLVGAVLQHSGVAS